MSRSRGYRAGLTWLGAILACAASPQAKAQTIQELRDLSIEDLGNVEITSVSKKPELLSRAAAAIFVISSEDIRRSGAVSLPEALRLAPNLQVARLNALSYAVSARGFNSFEAANKLLVLIDGRSIYSPLHAGIFWDQQQLPLADIEQIEVISGLGGTLWGANAVNGVINIITRNSHDTQGGLVDVKGGNLDRTATVRFGGKVADTGAYRAYALGTDYGSSRRGDGTSLGDNWHARQGGFRTDWHLGSDTVTIQGDVFDNAISGGSDLSGGNLLGRWARQLESDGRVEVQAYYDKSDRLSPGLTDRVETVDVQAQHSVTIGSSHAVVWGGGYRHNREKFDNRSNIFVLDPITDNTELAHLFVQDSILLREDLSLTLGVKLEHNSFTGLEYLPSARLGWRLTDTMLLWSAISRAVRTPTRLDRDLVAPGILTQAGSFHSEKLIAFEAGYRGRPTESTSLSVSLFYNTYEDLRVLAAAPGGGLPLTFANRMKGDTYGIEVWGDYRIRDSWRLSAGFNTLHKNLRLESGAITTAIDQHAGNDPSYQASLRSTINLTGGIEVDLALRVVDELDLPRVPSYVAFDARLGWRITDSIDLSLSGFNLLDARHPETGQPATRGEARRSIYAGIRWIF